MLKPTARLLTELYFFKNPMKILELRPDSLAQILTWINVQAGSKVLLIENCQGLIAGAIMERLGSSGNLVQLYQGSFPVRIIMEQFNFAASDTQQVLSSFPLENIGALSHMFGIGKSNEDLVEHVFGKKVAEVNVIVDRNGARDESVEPKIDDKISSQCQKSEDNYDFKLERGKRKHNDDGHINRITYLTKEQRRRECLSALNNLRENDFDSLVIVSKYHPKALLLSLLEFLPRGCAFVVYYTHQEPLMECCVTLREMNVATNLELTESYFRNIQVLSKRTHPGIVMSATGGYILRGIKVDA